MHIKYIFPYWFIETVLYGSIVKLDLLDGCLLFATIIQGWIQGRHIIMFLSIALYTVLSH